MAIKQALAVKTMEAAAGGQGCVSLYERSH